MFSLMVTLLNIFKYVLSSPKSCIIHIRSFLINNLAYNVYHCNRIRNVGSNIIDMTLIENLNMFNSLSVIRKNNNFAFNVFPF